MVFEQDFFKKLFEQIRNLIAILTKHLFKVKEYVEELPTVGEDAETTTGA